MTKRRRQNSSPADEFNCLVSSHGCFHWPTPQQLQHIFSSGDQPCDTQFNDCQKVLSTIQHLTLPTLIQHVLHLDSFRGPLLSYFPALQP
jgi:hypothetical protein